MIHFKASAKRAATPESMKSQFSIKNVAAVSPSKQEKVTFSKPRVVTPVAQQSPRSRNTPSLMSRPVNAFVNYQRCASAPISRQDPHVLRELAGMMKNTVAIGPAGIGLSLAPPTPSPSASPALAMQQPPQVIIQPISAVKPAAAKPQQGTTSESNPISDKEKKPAPNIGGGAFKKVPKN
mmetsp:Transcript_15079/g.19068  ORF Transcript_15079/g.19068 Transcript_15079/m.19068 type:complete len:180 (-) Transcript_15079:61-600(-)